MSLCSSHDATTKTSPHLPRTIRRKWGNNTWEYCELRLPPLPHSIAINTPNSAQQCPILLSFWIRRSRSSNTSLVYVQEDADDEDTRTTKRSRVPCTRNFSPGMFIFIPIHISLTLTLITMNAGALVGLESRQSEMGKQHPTDMAMEFSSSLFRLDKEKWQKQTYLPFRNVSPDPRHPIVAWRRTWWRAAALIPQKCYDALCSKSTSLLHTVRSLPNQTDITPWVIQSIRIAFPFFSQITRFGPDELLKESAFNKLTNFNLNFANNWYLLSREGVWLNKPGKRLQIMFITMPLCPVMRHLNFNEEDKEHESWFHQDMDAALAQEEFSLQVPRCLCSFFLLLS